MTMGSGNYAQKWDASVHEALLYVVLDFFRLTQRDYLRIRENLPKSGFPISESASSNASLIKRYLTFLCLSQKSELLDF